VTTEQEIKAAVARHIIRHVYPRYRWVWSWIVDDATVIDYLETDGWEWVHRSVYAGHYWIHSTRKLCFSALAWAIRKAKS
jgi:hypothetical protein